MNDKLVNMNAIIHINICKKEILISAQQELVCIVITTLSTFEISECIHLQFIAPIINIIEAKPLTIFVVQKAEENAIK